MRAEKGVSGRETLRAELGPERGRGASGLLRTCAARRGRPRRPRPGGSQFGKRGGDYPLPSVSKRAEPLRDALSLLWPRRPAWRDAHLDDGVGLAPAPPPQPSALPEAPAGRSETARAALSVPRTEPAPATTGRSRPHQPGVWGPFTSEGRGASC